MNEIQTAAELIALGICECGATRGKVIVQDVSQRTRLQLSSEVAGRRESRHEPIILRNQQRSVGLRDLIQQSQERSPRSGQLTA